MTLTYPAVARARQILWLVTGEDKKEPLGEPRDDDIEHDPNKTVSGSEPTDRLVALTQPYQGRVRMTLTYPALADRAAT